LANGIEPFFSIFPFSFHFSVHRNIYLKEYTKMKNSRKVLSLVSRLTILFLLTFTAESKAQLKKMSAEQLTQESTAILYGKCSEIRCEWTADKDIILTHVTIIPEEYVKGNLGAEAVLTIPGGRVGDIVYEVSEMPVFIEGEEVFAFAWKHPSGKNLVTGGYQGKLKIEKDKKTGKKTVPVIASVGLDDTAKAKDEKESKRPKKVLLDDFINEVKGFTNN